MAIACANAKPSILSVAPVAYSAPLVAAAPPFVTATSSQVVRLKKSTIIINVFFPFAKLKLMKFFQVSRNYNAAYVASPVIAASPYIASPAAPFAYANPYFASPVPAPVLL